jgi:hypothetical protein
MLKRFMNKLFLSCLKATELLEKRLHLSLNRKERYQLTIHKMMCDACRRYDRQSILIDNHFKYQDVISDKQIDVDELKKNIHEKLGN